MEWNQGPWMYSWAEKGNFFYPRKLANSRQQAGKGSLYVLPSCFTVPPPKLFFIRVFYPPCQWIIRNRPESALSETVVKRLALLPSCPAPEAGLGTSQRSQTLGGTELLVQAVLAFVTTSGPQKQWSRCLRSLADTCLTGGIQLN